MLPTYVIRVNHMVLYKRMDVEEVSIFFREAGSPSKPTIVLLHGFPSSSHMFRYLIPLLADQFHVVAPDYPGFGNSSMPAAENYEYSFNHLSIVIEKF
jgi:pimeloyl-ACP methyl ester carboxylesterase